MPLLATEVAGVPGYTAALTFIVAFGLAKAGDQLLRRDPVRPLRPQAGPGGRVAGRPPRPLPADLGPVDRGAGRVRRTSCSRHQPGPDLVDDRGDEDRPRFFFPLRPGDGVQRGRRVRRRRASGAGHRVHRRGPRAATCPFYLGIAFAGLGLGLSTLFVKETREHARLEAWGHVARADGRHDHLGDHLTNGQVFTQTSFKEPALSAASQGGLVNNLNDGLAWGLFEVLFLSAGLSIERIGLLATFYPMVWGVGQLVTGGLSDRWGRKWLIAGGMGVQAVGLGIMALADGFAWWALAAVLLGAGTAMVYPTLLAAFGRRRPPPPGAPRRRHLPPVARRRFRRRRRARRRPRRPLRRAGRHRRRRRLTMSGVVVAHADVRDPTRPRTVPPTWEAPMGGATRQDRSVRTVRQSRQGPGQPQTARAARPDRPRASTPSRALATATGLGLSTASVRPCRPSRMPASFAPPTRHLRALPARRRRRRPLRPALHRRHHLKPTPTAPPQATSAPRPPNDRMPSPATNSCAGSAPTTSSSSTCDPPRSTPPGTSPARSRCRSMIFELPPRRPPRRRGDRRLLPRRLLRPRVRRRSTDSPPPV